MADVKTDSNVVSAIGLTKVFKDFWGRPKAKAVNDIDFEIKKGEAELRWLQYQINPHFIHNTLNAISIRLLDDGNTEISQSVKTRKIWKSQLW